MGLLNSFFYQDFGSVRFMAGFSGCSAAVGKSRDASLAMQ